MVDTMHASISLEPVDVSLTRISKCPITALLWSIVAWRDSSELSMRVVVDVIVPVSLPIAAFAEADVLVSARLPSESALESEATELPAVARASPSRSLPWEIACVSEGACPCRPASAASAEAIELLVLSMAVFMSPMESRTSPRVSDASDTEPASESLVWVALSLRSMPASLAMPATVSPTVETNSELICSSMVLAPVSVTLGAIALFFSLT